MLTMALAYVSTLFAGYFAYGVSVAAFPSFLSAAAISESATAKAFPVYFALKIPPVMDVVSALAISFIIGLGIIATKAERLLAVTQEFKCIVEKTLEKAFVPLLPLYILTVMAELTASGRLAVVAGSAVKLAVTCFAINLVILLVQYGVAGVIARRPPLASLGRMLPAYLTGWGTCSSAATIPVTLQQVRRNGVSEAVANLVVPLCSNIHLAGSMANVVAYSAGILILYGQGLSLAAYTEFILMMSIVAVASPGVPGGCVLAAGAFVDSILGFTPEMYALMVSVYLALDGMGTACNLTGDGAIALIVERLSGRTTSAQ